MQQGQLVGKIYNPRSSRLLRHSNPSRQKHLFAVLCLFADSHGSVSAIGTAFWHMQQVVIQSGVLLPFPAAFPFLRSSSSFLLLLPLFNTESQETFSFCLHMAINPFRMFSWIFSLFFTPFPRVKIAAAF